MKLSRKQKEIEARKAADVTARLTERDDIDYSSDELPTAPRSVTTRADTPLQFVNSAEQKACCCPDWMPAFSGRTGKPFIYCPWCGVTRKAFEQQIASKAAELHNKGLL